MPSIFKCSEKFEVARQLYRFLPVAIQRKVISEGDITIFHESLNSVGGLLAALFFYDLPTKGRGAVLKKLASLLNKKDIDFPGTLTSKKDFLFQKCYNTNQIRLT